MLDLRHLSDADVRALADHMTRLGIFPAGFRAPAAPPLVASVGQVGPVALDFPVVGVPVVFAKGNTTRSDRTTDISASIALNTAGLAVPVKSGALYRIQYTLTLALIGAGLGQFAWDVGALTFALWVQQAGAYTAAPTGFTSTAGIVSFFLTVRPNADGVIDLNFGPNPLGGGNVATVKAGAFVDAWRTA